MYVFQSAPPRRGRHVPQVQPLAGEPVSIRAPAKGATAIEGRLDGVAKVSIRAPREGGDAR